MRRIKSANSSHIGGSLTGLFVTSLWVLAASGCGGGSEPAASTATGASADTKLTATDAQVAADVTEATKAVTRTNGVVLTKQRFMSFLCRKGVAISSSVLMLAACGGGGTTTAGTGTDPGVTTGTGSSTGSGTGTSGTGTSGTGTSGTGSSGTGSNAGSGSTPAVTSTNLCQGLISDKAVHPMTALAKPARGQAVTDPQFGTRIVRISDVVAQFSSAVAKPAYSTIPAWNADESLMILYVTQGSSTGHYLFDGKTYEFIRKLDIFPTDIEHFYWSSTDPDILFYPFTYDNSGTPVRQLIRYHVSTGAKETVRAFAGTTWAVDFGGDPMYSSWDNDLFGLRARGTTDQGFTYRISTQRESARTTGTAAQVSASGTYYVLNGNVYNANTDALVRPLASYPLEHADMGKLVNGQDFWASVQFDNYQGSLVVENLNTGSVRTVIGPSTGYPYPPTGTHVSAVSFRNPGWVAVSVIGNTSGAGLLDQELVLANLNNDTVCRVAHHRSKGDAYWNEPHVNISPSGTRLLFGSDWGGGSSVDAYVVELPTYQR